MKLLRSAQKALCLVLVAAIFLAGCGGHAANPVDRYILGDEKKSCDALYAEMSQMDQDIILKNKEKDGRDLWNIAFFVSGFVIIVPWFFMDVKGSHEVELEALRARKKALQIIFSEKDCTPPELKPAERQPKEQTRLFKAMEALQVVSSARAGITSMQLQPSLGA